MREVLASLPVLAWAGGVLAVGRGGEPSSLEEEPYPPNAPLIGCREELLILCEAKVEGPVQVANVLGGAVCCWRLVQAMLLGCWRWYSRGIKSTLNYKRGIERTSIKRPHPTIQLIENFHIAHDPCSLCTQ